MRRRIVLVNRRGLHHRAESVVAQRVHLAAARAEVFQFLLSRELNLFLIVFLVTHMFPFFSVRSLRTFFLSNGTKKAPRAVRGSFSASFDGMILAHFCSVCIRVFRHDSDDYACTVSFFPFAAVCAPRFCIPLVFHTFSLQEALVSSVFCFHHTDLLPVFT